MTDPIRIALFSLSLAALLFSTLAIVSTLRLGAVGSVLALWIVSSSQIVLFAQALSLLHQLDWPGFLVGHLLMAAVTAVWVFRHPDLDVCYAARTVRAGLGRTLRLALDWRSPAVPVIVVALLVTGLTCALVALIVPPNNSDSLGYHMTRVGFYLQFRSFDNYPTMIPRQVFYPANAEVLILWSVAFLRSDRLANLPQLIAWGITTTTVYGLGRLAGFRTGAALLGAGLFALLPQSVLQTGSAHNDLVVTGFLAVCLYFMIQAARAPHPTALLVLAGAAGGLAVGTKGTALLAVPVYLLVFAFLFGRRLDRRLLPRLLVAGALGVLLGAYFYVQNWWLYGSPIGPVGGRLASAGSTLDGVMTVRDGFLANLGRTLWTGAFADLSGPLANRAASPVAVPLIRELAAFGQWAFDLLAIPTVVPGLDNPNAPTFTFAKDRVVQDYSSGVGFLGGVMILVALAVLAWPRHGPAPRRLLGLSALGYLAALWLLVPFDPFTAGRFLLTGCALAAPLLGGALLRDGRWWRALALAVAMWSGATGLYVAAFNQHRPAALLARPGWLAERDWLSLLMLATPGFEPLFREFEEEVGPDTALAVTVGRQFDRFPDYTEYQFFGPRLARTVVPLVHPSYLERMRQPLPWTNADLIRMYRPAYLAVAGRRSPADLFPPDVAGRCYELPLTYARPPVTWQLLRCDDLDPRNRLANGDVSAWTGGRGIFFAGGTGPVTVATSDSWWATATGGARLAVSQLDAPVTGAEPFRALLRYRPGTERDGEGFIFQDLPLDDTLRGMSLVVDARVWSAAAGSVVLRVEDGIATTTAMNLGTDPETLRARHVIRGEASRLRVSLALVGSGQETEVRLRSVLAIPRPPTRPLATPVR